MATDRHDAGVEASEHDLEEQQRDVTEDPCDPERTARPEEPDASSTSADPADVQEQSIEVDEGEDGSMV